MDKTPNAGVDDRVETSSVKLCVECKHYRFEDNSEMREQAKEYGVATSSIWLDKHLCFHPSFKSLDVVTGKIHNNERECYKMRNKFSTLYEECGEEAKLWEPKQ